MRARFGGASAAKAKDPAFHRLLAVLACTVYWGVSVTTYQTMVAPVYEYSGLTDRDLPMWCWATMLSLAIAPVLFLDLTFRRVSAITSWLIYVVLVVPCCIVPVLTANSEPSESIWISVSLVGCFIVFETMRARPLFRISRIANCEVQAIGVLVPASLLILSFLVLQLNGFKFSLSDLLLDSDMYARRLQARDLIGQEGLTAYAFATVTGAGLPFVIAGAITKRSAYMALVALFSTAVIVSFNGTRSTLLFPVLCALSMWIVSRKAFGWLYLLIGFTSLPVLISRFGSIELLALLVVRMQSIPAQLTTIYYQLAHDTPNLLFRDLAVFGWIGQSNPLGQSLPRFIGATFFHSSQMNANANMWAHAEVEVKIIGPIVTSLLAGALLRLLDSIVERKGTAHVRLIAAGLCTYWALAWANGAFQTSLFSNGVIVGVILVAILPGRDVRSAVARYSRAYAPAGGITLSRIVRS